jgi:hypothetical protein
MWKPETAVRQTVSQNVPISSATHFFAISLLMGKTSVGLPFGFHSGAGARPDHRISGILSAAAPASHPVSRPEDAIDVAGRTLVLVD